MMLLVIGLEPVKDGDRLRNVSVLYDDLLESPVKSSVFLYIFPELVKGGCSDTLYVAPCKCRLQHVGCIKAARRSACSDDCVELVDEQYHVRACGHLVYYVLESLLEVSAIFCACHYGAHVKCDESLVCKDRRNVSCDYLYRNSFNYSRFAHSGISDKHRVVLPSSSKNLNDSLYLVLASYERVQPAFAGCLCHVITELLKRRYLPFRLRFAFMYGSDADLRLVPVLFPVLHG